MSNAKGEYGEAGPQTQGRQKICRAWAADFYRKTILNPGPELHFNTPHPVITPYLG
ncbi:MAG: hypothetical protein PUK73_00070 [Spirochaetota bacterium]|uniref:hypothetical protein n=1 Tax=Candidatus Avelusimicrobium faecicola TaxID=3416205 RepID=UPI002A5D40E6|nr:hypothetical protein [Spirochaetota bacterium]MDY6129482.1 hypothetical protein [Elusimicrobiaceae bacterium]